MGSCFMSGQLGRSLKIDYKHLDMKRFQETSVSVTALLMKCRSGGKTFFSSYWYGELGLMRTRS